MIRTKARKTLICDSAMGKYLWTIPMILLIAGFSGCNSSLSQDDAADVAAITALSSARAKAFNEGNADGIAIHFTPDAILMAPGMPAASGRDAVRDYYQSIFDEYATELKSGYEEVRVSGDMAYGRGIAHVRLIPHLGGDALISSAKYINILERQKNGSWLTTHDIWNGDE